MQYGDKQAIAEYVKEAAEIRQKLESQKERSRLEYDLLREGEKLRKNYLRLQMRTGKTKRRT